MKRTALFIILIFIVFSADCRIQYADYSTNSGLDRRQIDSAAIENLEVLGRVWGYVKYHHPLFLDGAYDLDYELFELLPQVVDENPTVRNKILTKWIDDFGRYKIATEKYEKLLFSDSISTHCTNIHWILDTVKLGHELSERLVRLRHADRKGNYYITKTKIIHGGIEFEAENPSFNNEKSYSSLSCPDYGYRLLAVFRFWNMVEYFYPSKYLTDKKWDVVLPEYISRMAYHEKGDYCKDVWRMISELNDNHAQGGNSLLFGDYRIPLNVKFVEGKLMVVTPDTVPVTPMRFAPFHIGDEIIAIDDKPVSHYTSLTREFIPCSNEASVLYATADMILRSQRSMFMRICYWRNGVEKDTLASLEMMRNSFEATYLYEYIDATKIMDNSIGYIYPAKYKYPNQQINDLLIKTKELIIDMRCYPNN